MSVCWQLEIDRSLKDGDGKVAFFWWILRQNGKQQRRQNNFIQLTQWAPTRVPREGKENAVSNMRNMMMGWKEINVLTLFLGVLPSPVRSWIENEMCWILAFTIRSIFAQFSHYLNVHFCAIFYTLVFGFRPHPIVSFWVPLCSGERMCEKIWKFIGSYHVNEIVK